MSMYLGKLITKRGWVTRVVFLLSVGLMIFMYYVSFAFNSPSRLVGGRFSGVNQDDRSSSIFAKFLYGSNSKGVNGQKTIDGVHSRRDHDPRKNLKHKIIHLDLKGMPPLIKYYKDLFPLLKQIGVTGLLVEYEDMFPFHGKLQPIANRECYSKAHIKKLNQLAKINELQVIPLVQTFGHLEMLLKLDNFMHLREVPRYPQVICPTNNQSKEIVREMIDQVMSLHPGIEYFHIGSDEVYHVGQCPLCTERMSDHSLTSSDLILDHVSRVAQYVRDTYDVKPLMWDDQFRNMDEDLIIRSGLPSLVEIVVWDYTTSIRIAPAVWEKYARVFQTVWVGSSFKGANEPSAMVVNETLYLANHMSWVDTMQEQESHISFEGVMLTGWQRFDHFAVPCELLPLAIPSLVACMTYLNTSKYSKMEDIFLNVSEILECTTKLEYCRFPGSAVHQDVKYLHRLQLTFQRIKKSNIYLGWANRANLVNQFSSPSYIDSLFYEVNAVRNDLQRMEPTMENNFKEIYPGWSVNEWMYVNFRPFKEEIISLCEGLARILDHQTFPVRPLLYPVSTNRNKTRIKV